VRIDDLPTRIYFSRGSCTPTGGSLTVLRKYAEWLAGSRTRALYVVGHANLRLKGKAALALADARARAVRDLLVWLGARRGQVRRMTPSRMHQIRSNSTSSARAANRSVEIVVAPGGSVTSQRPVPRRGRSARGAVAAA